MMIRMLATASGAFGTYTAGQVVEVDDATAVAWLNAGYAEAVKRTGESAVVTPKEQAVDHVQTSRDADRDTDLTPTDSADQRAGHTGRRKRSPAG